MPPDIGTIETVSIRKVWPKEDADFTPWLRSHIKELDKTLGLGLTNPRSEVGAGDFRIDLLAATSAMSSSKTSTEGATTAISASS